MNERKKYITGLLCCLAAGVLLLTPIGLNLKPSDPGIIRGGTAIAVNILVFGGLVYFGVMLARVKPAVSLTDNKKEEIRIQNLLREMRERPVIGAVARKALEQMEDTSRKAGMFREIVGKKFGDTSLTFVRYAGVLDEGVDTIVQNTSFLTARLQAFDEKQYLRLSRSVATGLYKSDAVDDSLQEDQLVRFNRSLQEMNGILDANEHLLDMMGSCVNEVAALGAEDNSRKNEDILEEITHLIETTKYYK